MAIAVNVIIGENATEVVAEEFVITVVEDNRDGSVKVFRGSEVEIVAE